MLLICSLRQTLRHQAARSLETLAAKNPGFTDFLNQPVDYYPNVEIPHHTFERLPTLSTYFQVVTPLSRHLTAYLVP